MIHEIRVLVELPDDTPQMMLDTVRNAAALGVTSVPLPETCFVIGATIQPYVPETAP